MTSPRPSVAEVDATFDRTDPNVGRRLTLSDGRGAVIEARDGSSYLVRPDGGGLLRMSRDELALKHGLVAAPAKAAAPVAAAPAAEPPAVPAAFAIAVQASLEKSKSQLEDHDTMVRAHLLKIEGRRHA